MGPEDDQQPGRGLRANTKKRPSRAFFYYNQPMRNSDILRDIYTKYPCRTLPNAFWKTATNINESRLDVTRGDDQEPVSVAIWEGERLMSLWCADLRAHSLDQAEIDSVSFALVHQSALPVFANRNFAVRRPYFRLVYEDEKPDSICPAGFAIECFKPEDDIESAVNVIRACYENMMVNPEIVRNWMLHPVYDPDLWLWVIDCKTGEKAALGIAERDSHVQEASLEWIQVLSAYRGFGIGKTIVTELLSRVTDRVNFTTVSGELENVYQPQKLYRQCGFTGDDVWWLLSDQT